MFRTVLLGIGALLAVQPILQAADDIVHYRSAPTAVDTYVVNGAEVSHAGDNFLLVGGTGNVNETFVRFRVDAATVGRGIPTETYLQLWQETAAPNGSVTTIAVYAANNRKAGQTVHWADTMTWSQKPRYIPGPLATATAYTVATLPVGGGQLIFDVTDYISGPGDYTFCVRVSSGLTPLVQFSSTENGTLGRRPDLVVGVNQNGAPVTDDGNPANDGIPADYDSEYFQRTAPQMQDLGEKYRDRYKASVTGGTSDPEVDAVGYFDVTKAPYLALPSNDGLTNALAIQRAVNEARAARVAVYLPAGNYPVSKTIELVMGDNPINYDIDGLKWTGREFPTVLLGARSGDRSIITLAGSSAGFTDALKPKAVLHFWSRENSRIPKPNDDGVFDNGISPEVNKANDLYNAILDNIDLVLNGGTNHGAIGVDMDGAQGSNITNCTITATGAYAGIVGGPGPGGYTYGVTVNGGLYGARLGGEATAVSDPGFLGDPNFAGEPHAPVIINSKFTNQSINSIYYAGRGPLNLVGVEIVGKGIKLAPDSDKGALYGNLTIEDSQLDVWSSGYVIEGNRSVALTNVYIKKYGGAGLKHIKLTDPTSVSQDLDLALPGAVGWLRIDQFVRGVNIVQTQARDTQVDGPASRVQSWLSPSGLEPTASGAAYILSPATPTSVTPAAPDYSGNAIGNRHYSVQSPVFSAVDTASLLNAKTTTTYPTKRLIQNEDPAFNPTTTPAANTANLQYLIDNASGKAVFLPRGNYTIGSTVFLRDNTTLFGMGAAFSILRPKVDFASNTPMLNTNATAGATTTLADLKLLVPMNVNGAVSMLTWRAGGNSAVRDVDFDRRLHKVWDPVEEEYVDDIQPLTVPVVKITGQTAGGKWYGLRLFASSNFGVGARGLEVNNVGNQKLSFYMLNIEHFDSSPQMSFVDADNFSIYQCKAESFNYNGASKNPNAAPNDFLTMQETFSFTNCSNFRAFGFAGTASPGVWLKRGDPIDSNHANIRLDDDSNDYLFTMITFQSQNPDNPATTSIPLDALGYYADDFRRVIWNGGGAAANSTVLGQEQAASYSRGTPPTQ